MESETTDSFPPSVATWRTGRNKHVVIDSGAFAPLCENMTSSTKPEVYVMSCIAVRKELSNGHR